MCGIAGVVGEGAGYHESINARVTAIKHRGPDSEGFFVEPGIELGMARLSIIDVAQGSQPVFNEDRKIVAVFNGEIYNHKRLRDELITTGHRFNSHSDSEVITHLYEEYGIEGIQKLNGMFAIAIWDSVSRVLFLIRDRFGEKPLYYENLKSGGLAFGSEVRSLMASGNENSRRPNFDTLNHILTFGYSPLSESAFAGINSIPPGSYLRRKQGVVEVKKYWNPPVVSQNFYRSYSEAKDATKVALEEAIALRMESERPLGVFLSGGVDSSLIAAFASQKSAKPLSTFTIGFRDNAYNESQWARNIALGYPFSDTYFPHMEKAALSASLIDFLENNLHGFETLAGERGLSMSGGQRQRLGIARALFTSPKLIILDEATSSLDSITENAISNALKNLRGEVTLIVKAHRLSTIINADQVVYMEEGKIIANGSFTEVKKQVPNFAEQARLMGI